MALEVWNGGEDADRAYRPLFPMGAPNNAYAAWFTGQSYLQTLAQSPLICNVTFEPGCRNNWHTHTSGRRRRADPALHRRPGLVPGVGRTGAQAPAGDTVVIPAGVKHWHGAAKDGWFSHLSVEVPGENTATQWLEPVDAAQYGALE